MTVAALVVIARRNPEKLAPPLAPTVVSPSVTVPPASSVLPNATADVPIAVKEISFTEGGADRVSIRIEHPDPGVQAKLKEFLEPREQAAIAKNTALDCHAQIAKTSLISLTCVTFVSGALDAAAGSDAGDEQHYESLTLRVSRGQVKVLALSDVLMPDAGQNEVVEGCKKAAEPDLACEWPPTDFAISPGGTLFLCHGSRCIDIDQDDAPNLLLPEFR